MAVVVPGQGGHHHFHRVHGALKVGEFCFGGCFPGKDDRETSMDQGEVRGQWRGWLLQGSRGRVQGKKLHRFMVSERRRSQLRAKVRMTGFCPLLWPNPQPPLTFFTNNTEHSV